MKSSRRSILAPLCAAPLLFLTGCGPSGPKKPVIGVSFETLQTEFWVAGYDAIKKECAAQGYDVAEAVADGDAGKQLEQIRSFITRKVDGIIMVPKDAKTCVPMIKAANAAGIPIVLFNRGADAGPDVKATAVVADNTGLTKLTVEYMVEMARKTGRKHTAAILLGDLGDLNGVARRDGAEAALNAAPDAVEVVARIPTEWNQEKAQAGVVNALQAHPEIDFIFTSSDFLLPSITSALKSAGKYHKAGEPGHVILGGFDGDATAWRLMQEGYLDATGVQDVYFEAKQSVQAIADQRAGKAAAPSILDPGFVIHRGNMAEKSAQMWGAHTGR
ncbi:MAG: LacI family transcriptional regulator [Verrucomicrobiales bacterium]|nr:LacI family transcriptional regulator [Verrucomicrobiales bacterium]